MKGICFSHENILQLTLVGCLCYMAIAHAQILNIGSTMSTQKTKFCDVSICPLRRYCTKYMLRYIFLDCVHKL